MGAGGCLANSCLPGVLNKCCLARTIACCCRPSAQFVLAAANQPSATAAPAEPVWWQCAASYAALAASTGQCCSAVTSQHRQQ